MVCEKSQSCSNLFDEDQYKKIARDNVKLDELMLTNKAIIIHTPTKTTNYNDHYGIDNSSAAVGQHHYQYTAHNYNFSVLGLQSYQNKKKHEKSVQKEDNNNDKIELSDFQC